MPMPSINGLRKQGSHFKEIYLLSYLIRNVNNLFYFIEHL